MNYLKATPIGIVIILISGFNNCIFSQTKIIGKVVDTNGKRALAYVNIGIREKNIGTISKEDGFNDIGIRHC